MKIFILISLLAGIVLFTSLKNIPQQNNSYKINDSIDSIEQTYTVDVIEDSLELGFIDTILYVAEPDTITEPADIPDVPPIDDYHSIDDKYAEPDTSTVH